MRYRRIPDETIRRLPIYLRGLAYLSQQGVEKVSSSRLAEDLHRKSPQIRKDFSYFGGFGTPGVGYDVQKLIGQIRKILKLNVAQKTALVGVGNLGSAILAYPGFKMYGFEIAAIFDSARSKIGKKISDLTVEDVLRLQSLKKKNVRLAIIAVPAESAQQVADALVSASVVGILNFAPCHLIVPKKVKVITVDMAMELARLPYYLPAG